MAKRKAKDSIENLEELNDIFSVSKTAQSEKYDVMPTQFETYNNYVLGCGGLPRGRMVEISGEPNMGKTTFLQNIAGYFQKQGLKVLWIPAEPIDEQYAIQSGMDLSKDCENPIKFLRNFTDATDLSNKIKLAVAKELFDLIVLDSIQAVNSSKFAEAQGDFNMNIEQSNAKFWTVFPRELEGGYRILKEITNKKPVYIEGNTSYKEFVNGKFVEDYTFHKLSDKKTCVVFINHLKNSSTGGLYVSKYTPGGVGKDFRFSIRTWLTSGGITKKQGTSEIIYSDVKFTSKKSKIGAPTGRSCVLRLKNGVFTDLNTTMENVIDEDEINAEL
jgi:recombination protein RecA